MGSKTFTYVQQIVDGDVYVPYAHNWQIAEGVNSDNTINTSAGDGTVNTDDAVYLADMSGNVQYDVIAKGVTANGTFAFYAPLYDAYFFLSDSYIYEDEASIGTITPQSFSVPCFLRGTLIATERGEVAVEDLAIGDLVKTMDGSFKPVTWVGKRSYLRLFTPLNRRNAVMPIRIAAGALAEGVPARDLHVSPKHALLLDGHLVAPELLVNGTTITRMDLDRVDYFHVKLEAHDVIFAEGTPAETYVVHGNLKSFNNWPEHEALFGPVDNDPASVDYAPRLRKGAALDKVRAAVADRAEGFALAV